MPYNVKEVMANKPSRFTAGHRMCAGCGAPVVARHILRALKEKKINSCIGIDGIIRKVGMILSIAFCFVIDYISHFNLIGFLPESITESLHLGQCGLAFIFNSLYIVFEGLSILKNMIKCKMPIPKKLQEYLEKLLYEFTNENKEK